MALSRPQTLKQLIRGLARPVTSPIDGRVADINSRVENTAHGVGQLNASVARLDEAVSVFSEAATESTSYVGIELGRMAGAIDALEKQVGSMSAAGRQDDYRRRLAAAVQQPLSALDGDLAALINHAAGHRGYAAQAELWFNSPVTIELSEGAARLAAVNERIVEVPFALMALSRLAAGARLLDVGSAESTFPLSAASLGYEVTAVDPRGLPYAHPRLHTLAGRFEDLPTPEARFDAVFLISTIEHVGLPAYGVTPRGPVEPGAGADRELLARVRGELLADDGIVVLTTPYGARAVDDFERTYDDPALTALLDGWTVLERRAASLRDGVVWEPVQTADEVGEDGVVMVVAAPAPS